MPKGDVSSSTQLNYFAPRLTSTPFYGCFSKDLIRPGKLGFSIVNLQSSKQRTFDGQSNGTHWTLVLYLPDKSCYYFDSFGFPPPLELTRGNIKCVYNTAEYQPLGSDLCGYYVLYVMAHMSGWDRVGRPMDINRKLLFTDDTRKNDAMMRRFKNGLS